MLFFFAAIIVVSSFFASMLVTNFGKINIKDISFDAEGAILSATLDQKFTRDEIDKDADTLAKARLSVNQLRHYESIKASNAANLPTRGPCRLTRRRRASLYVRSLTLLVALPLTSLISRRMYTVSGNLWLGAFVNTSSSSFLYLIGNNVTKWFGL